MAETGLATHTGRVELIVHIGDGKTGTSAIQRVLREHPSQLAADGTRYLGLMLEGAPSALYPWQKPGMIEAFHRLPADQAVMELQQVLAASVEDAVGTGVARLVWSNETLLGRSGTTIRALRALADRIDTTVVAYVRRHDRMARSAYLQWGLKHKTYTGPLADFKSWASRRKFAVAPKLQPWIEAFGGSMKLRNYDAVDDVTADFLAAIGLAPASYASARRNLPPPPAELALRSVFNAMTSERVAPHRFTTLFGSDRVDYQKPLEQWLSGLLPDGAALAEIRNATAEDAEALNLMLREAGQPPFDAEPIPLEPFRVDQGAVSAALMQMLAVQAERLEALERRLAMLERPAVHEGPIGGTEASDWPADSPRDEVRDALAPALGYFGALAADSLEVRVDGPILGLKLSLADSKPTFLNLRGMDLLRAGKRIAVADHRPATRMSSVADNESSNGAGNLLTNAGIHSRAELSPWWEARFERPVDCDSLRLWNRSDGWGSRSRTLRIEAMGDGGDARLIHDSQSPRSLTRALDGLVRAAASSPLRDWPATATEAARWREAALERVAARLASRELPLAAAPWRELLQAVDVWGRAGGPSAAAWTIMAAFLLFQHGGKGGTSIKGFSLVLNSRARLLRLQEEINALAAKLGLGRYMLTRHGVKAEGVLRREPEKFVAHMQAVVAQLEDLDREPVIAYGTLLGAVRDGDFIAHDDDMDLLYRSPATSRAEAEADLLGLKRQLQDRGFRVVDLLPNSLNIHVIDARNGAVMDVFPCWTSGGALQMHMEAMKIRGIDPDIVYPRGKTEFRGVRLPVPARPEAFLQERYGATWSIPDQFHEWPWPLEDHA